MCSPSIRAMYRSQDLHEQLMEDRLRRALAADRLHDLYIQLVALDPETGEAWYDSDAVDAHDLEKAIQQVENRIDQLIGT